MNRFFVSCLVLGGLFARPAAAQHTARFVVLDSATRAPLFGVAVVLTGTTNGATTDPDGRVTVANVPAGPQTFVVSYLGYQPRRQSLTLPFEEVTTVSLAATSTTLDEVVVTSTRTNSRIEDLPVRVEVLGLDDMVEENTIKPGNISSILGDLSVIHIQQTSAVNGNATVRMQGLDGKYTQILRDGLPLYEGFSGSFGILQIPPLDLKQVEIIKGSVSTLYGGGAISGLINLISKQPTDSTETSFTLNRSTLRETNLNGYFAKKIGKVGLTFFVGNTLQDAVDVNDDGFSDVPQITNTLIHPRVFFYFSPRTTLNAGLSSLFENRNGGDMVAINAQPTAANPYLERNRTTRTTFDANLRHNLGANQNLTLKGTLGLFDRAVDQSGFLFGGRQLNGYGEASYFGQRGRHALVGGLNYIAEQFTRQNTDPASLVRNYDYQTLGAFAQDGWQLAPKLMLETGLRTDYHNVYGWFVLPRVAFLYRPLGTLSVRLSSGLGYKTPNIFTQQTLSGSFRNLLPLDNTVVAERSLGANADVNYSATIFGAVEFQLNQAFYLTRIRNPIAINAFGNGQVGLVNARYDVNSLGTDTYLRFAYQRLELYLGYNHTVARRVGDGTDVFLPFSPQDKFASTFTYEVPGKWRVGLENSFVASQYIDGNVRVPNYWFFAGMVERKFRHVSVVLNCENLFDYRQSRVEAIVLPPRTNPTFRGLWAPIDGRAVNLAVRVQI